MIRLDFRNCARSLVVATVMLSTWNTQAVFAQQAKFFATPEQAVQALHAAGQLADQSAIFDVLGGDAKEWVLSGDAVQDEQARERFVAAYDQKNTIEKQDEDTAVLVIGEDKFPFPIPIVRWEQGWSFDAELGKEEILNRRIGRNELHTIQVLRAIVDAQDDYASVDRNDDGIVEYASRFRSSPGQKNGLYWPVEDGEEPSPIGALVADAVREGYEASGSDYVTVPFHGYHFRILSSQGTSASGGAFDYFQKGKMIGGFAVIAYPTKYGVSGFKTFLVNHDGVVYERDLGDNTLSAVGSIKMFDPDDRWDKS
ncbi:MAG: DUF2950 domain-containing protein [Bythopirellula sp.]